MRPPEKKWVSSASRLKNWIHLKSVEVEHENSYSSPKSMMRRYMTCLIYNICYILVNTRQSIDWIWSHLFQSVGCGCTYWKLMRLLVCVPLCRVSLFYAAAKSITLPMMVHCLSCIIDDHFPLNSLIMLIGESTEIEPTQSKTRKHLTLRILLWSVNTTQQKHTHLISFWASIDPTIAIWSNIPIGKLSPTKLIRNGQFFQVMWGLSTSNTLLWDL